AGRITWRSSNKTFHETDGTAEIVLRRSGGSSGRIEANWHTTNAPAWDPQGLPNATPNVDFVPTKGFTNWSDHETEDKVIQVPLLLNPDPVDDVSSRDKRFMVHLTQRIVLQPQPIEFSEDIEVHIVNVPTRSGRIGFTKPHMLVGAPGHGVV